MTLLFLTGLIMTTTLLLTLDSFDDEGSVATSVDDTEPAGNGDGSATPPAPSPDPVDVAPPDDPIEDEPAPPVVDDPDTGASLFESVGAITLERGDDETRTFLAVRAISMDSGEIDGEQSETAWLDFYLVPEGVEVPKDVESWTGPEGYEAKAAGLGLEAVGRVALGMADLDLDAYAAGGSQPDFTDTRSSAPTISANAPLERLAIDGVSTDGVFSVINAHDQDTLDPVIPGEALVWRLARTPTDDDWDFDLSRIRASDAITGGDADDLIVVAPFESADVAINGGAGADRIETGIGPDINGGAGSDNIILTLPAFSAAVSGDPWADITEIAFADTSDSLAVLLPKSGDGPVFELALTETSGGGNVSALEYSRILVQASSDFVGVPTEAVFSTLLENGTAEGLRILARIQLGAELVTSNGDGSTSAIGIHNATPEITYVGSLAGTAALTLPALAA